MPGPAKTVNIRFADTFTDSLAKLTADERTAAKGLEFRSVTVMACDQSVIPLASREAAAADMVEMHEVNETERHLLYVAVTRARDDLWVSGVAPGSVFLKDLGL